MNLRYFLGLILIFICIGIIIVCNTSSNLDSLSDEVFMDSVLAIRTTDISKKLPMMISTSPQDLANMFFLLQGNQYDPHYSGDVLFLVDTLTFRISCYLGNNGKKCWIPKNYNLTNLFEIVSLKISTNEFLPESYKSSYHPFNHCFANPPSPCISCIDSIGLGVNTWDQYDNEGAINGEGSYAVMFIFNDSRLIPESNYKDNIYFLGLTVFRRSDGFLEIITDNSILTRKLKLQLAHHK